jgi:hypothetical protein
MAIQSADDFISAVNGDEEENYRAPLQAARDFDKVDPVIWSPPASLEGGDTASRLGIPMGEPQIKAAAFRAYLLETDFDSEKIAFPGMVAGAKMLGSAAIKAAPKVFGAAKSVGKGLMSPAVGKATDAAVVGGLAHTASNINRTATRLG